MSEKRWLAVIFSLYVVMAITYSWLIPPWEGPDEPAHYILAVNLARVGIFSRIERNYEAGQPQTYYRLASGPLKVLYELNPDWVEVVYPERDYGNVRKPAPIFFWSDENYLFLPGVYVLRWLNIAMGAGALGLNYAAMKRFFLGRLKSQQQLQSLPSQAVPLTALALAALTPQFLHTTSTVANDALGILTGAFLFWLLVKIALEDIRPVWLGWAIILGIVLPVTTKLTALPVGLVAIVGVTLKARERWPQHWKRFVGGGLMVGGGAVLLLVIILPEMGTLLWRQIQLRALSVSAGAFSPAYLWEMVSQVVWSYWGKVGWLAVGLPGWVVVGLTGLGLVGIGAEGRRRGGEKVVRRKGEKGWESGGEGVGEWWVWLAVGLTIMAVLKNGLSTVNSQGRHLFPAIGPLTLLMASGWDDLLPARFRSYLLPGVIVLMLGVNLVLWVWGIIPAYYQPFWD